MDYAAFVLIGIGYFLGALSFHPPLRRALWNYIKKARERQQAKAKQEARIPKPRLTTKKNIIKKRPTKKKTRR